MAGDAKNHPRLFDLAGESTRIPPASEIGGRTRTLVSFSSAPGDHQRLEQLLCCDNWAIYAAYTQSSALSLMRAYEIPLVLCDADAAPTAWKELLQSIADLPGPPLLIVASRLADERLWAEALNLGAYDVVAKPLNGAALSHVLGQAWLHWKYQQQGATRVLPRAMKAAS